MQKRNMDEMISYFNRKVADMDIEQKYKMELLGMITAIGIKYEQSERKTGKWIATEFDGYADGYPVYCEWRCSACGVVVEDEEPTWNYCPNCGAKMEAEP